jgi:hypothetical protein
MKWRLIDKSATAQPEKGTYSSWKPILADEGFHQCVYCAISEHSFGGIRNFHVEHYKPKKRFPELKNAIANLFYACAVCNTFKNDDWPVEPPSDFGLSSYPDPSVIDYSKLFELDASTGTVQGVFVASKYIVERLYLNRPQLIIERRTHTLFDRLVQCRTSIDRLLPVAQAGDIILLAALLSQLVKLHELYRFTIPYAADDVTRA